MTSSHLDLDALADLLAGEGSQAHVAHVGDCAGCAGRLDELATADLEVAAALAALPVPAVPAGLAERLERALAAEPPLTPSAGPPLWAVETDDAGPGDAGEEGAGGAGAGDRAASRTVTPFPAVRTRRWAPAAAAAALLVAAGTLGGVLLVGRDDDQNVDSLAAGGGGQDQSAVFGDLPTSSTGRDYGADGELASALPDLLEGDAPTRAGSTAAGPEPVSGEPPAAARDTADEASTEAMSSAVGDPLDRLRDPAELASCLTALLPPDDPSVRPEALDYAAYDGQPALVVVLPALDAPDKVDVFVVGAECRAGDDRTLFFTRLDRP
ncbi:MAG TPA: hypothetical protein VNU26_19070 [Mycobacteriales bacterium]|nr:hypothetical protein [Mycobacteriales bacterium]